MSKLKIEDISAELQKQNWRLVSETYKNLDTDLEMICPNGHKVFMCLKKWRRHQDCPICNKAHIVKNLSVNIPRKKADKKRILALDDATGVTGYAVFDGDELITYGKISMNALNTIERIVGVRQWLISMITNWNPDIVSIEDIQLQQGRFENVKTFKVLAQLQGTLLSTLFEEKIESLVVPPATWRSTCGITARTRSDQKRQAQQKVLEWYDIKTTQDEADAICIGYHTAIKHLKNNYMINWEESND